MSAAKSLMLYHRIVETPLWTDHPKVMERFSVTQEISITAEDVAKAMDSLVEDGSYPGGTILEISKAGIRVIPEWNIDPPKDLEGTTVAPEAMQKALGPILARSEQERHSL